MRGVILCGGLGTRLRPLTHTGAKHLIPVAGKPILYYAIESLVGAGITEIAIVASGATRAQLAEAVGPGELLGATIELVAQERALGLANAVEAAREFVDDEPFVVYLGDNIIHGGIADFVAGFRDECEARVLVAQVDDPQRFGVVLLEGERVVRLVEKPREYVSDLAIVGLYAFRSSIFDAIASISPSARGELEITDAIQHLVSQGRRVSAHRLREWWADTGRPEDVLDANRRMLLAMAGEVLGTVDAASSVTGEVHVGEGSSITGSVIRGPVWIGAGCSIEASYIGPYTSISDDCEVRGTEIEHSVVLPHCTLDSVPTRIGSSLIGNRVTVCRRTAPPNALQLVLGDESVVCIA